MAEADPQKTFEVESADNELSKLFDRAHAGEIVILSKGGIPFAKLIPYTGPSKGPRTPGRYKHLLGSISDEDLFSPCFTDEELDRFYDEDVDPDRR